MLFLSLIAAVFINFIAWRWKDIVETLILFKNIQTNIFCVSCKKVSPKKMVAINNDSFWFWMNYPFKNLSLID